MASEKLDKMVENYQKNCIGGEYDYLDTNHLKRAFEQVYKLALDDFRTALTEDDDIEYVYHKLDIDYVHHQLKKDKEIKYEAICENCKHYIINEFCDVAFTLSPYDSCGMYEERGKT